MIPPLELTFASIEYLDRFQVRGPGIPEMDHVFLRQISFTPEEIGELFRRVILFDEFDVAECSLASYISMRSAGNTRWTGLPVFPSRGFRLREIYVNAAAEIQKPQDLVGCRVGVLEYGMTAAVTVRGLLLEEFGVDWRQLRWITGPLTPTSRYLPRFKDGEANPWGVELAMLPDGRNLEAELSSGGLDALVTVRPPHAFLEDPEGSGIARLFPDAHDREADLYRRTGAFPIMHLIVVRTDLVEAHPWLARTLFRALTAMRAQHWQRLQSAAAAPVGLPWIDDLVEESRAVFGGDPYEYGVEPNRPSLELCLRFCEEQGMTASSGLTVEDLFLPELLQPEMVE